MGAHRSKALGATVMGVVLATTVAAHALTRKEAACQAAIARAGRAFVAAELASRSRCLTQLAKGKACDPSGRTTVNRARLEQTIGQCSRVTLAHLGAGGCAASSTYPSALGTCLVSGHELAIASLLTDEFGLAAH